MIKTVAVIGLGAFGQTVCEVITAKGCDVIAIDQSEAQVNRVKNFVSQAVLLDATDEESISQAPLDQVDAAIVGIGDNIEASILTTALLKQVGVPHIVARAINKVHYQVLKKVGAHEVLNIEEDQGQRVALNLIAPSVMDTVKLSRDIQLTEMYLPPAYYNIATGNLNLWTKFSLRLVALRRMDVRLDAEGETHREERLLFPDKDDPLLEGDVLILVGSERALEDFQKSGA